MKREITLRQYRTIDLVLTLLIMLASQAVIYFAATKWYLDQLYIVSPVAAVTAIILMRWGPYAALHAFAGGAAHCLLFGGGWTQLLIYSAGNLLSLFALFLIKKQGKKNVRSSANQTVLLGVLVQALMLLGRAGIALLLGFEAPVCLTFITTDALSILFTGLIVWIARRVDGLFEDQKHYLLRMHRQDETQGGELP